MNHPNPLTLIPIIGMLSCLAASVPAGEVVVDLSGFHPRYGVSVTHQEDRLTLTWPLEGGERGQIVVDLRENRPLFESVSIAVRAGEPFRALLQAVDPVAFVVVGERKGTVGRPPEMSDFNEFFDSPANRPHQSYRTRLDLKNAGVRSFGRRTTLALGDVTAGPFKGVWQHHGLPWLPPHSARSRREDHGGAPGFRVRPGSGERVGTREATDLARYREETPATALDSSAQDRPLAVRHRAARDRECAGLGRLLPTSASVLLSPAT